MASEQKHGPLQQYLLLAKSLRGAALVSLIRGMLEAPGVYSFGEFLDLPCVKELSLDPNDGYSKLLNVFAYGTYNDYKANEGTLPPLSEAQKKKLRHLTLATLAANTQCIPYSVLQKALEVANIRQLEDLLIEAVYSNVIRGKLDQCKQQLEVDASFGRDMCPQNTGELVQTLKDWCLGCESVCFAIESQVHRVRQSRECRLQSQQQVYAEVSNIRNMLTAAASSSPLSSAVHCELEGTPEEHGGFLKSISKNKSISSPKH
ncbi:COP9 signalosome complex subunit 7a [Salminus brasiliensis]|uniref:COP9 signalosome complex subunit 7a n=1 Tax=Salminus brasiliensis TaxID=930266 RepID=UPI003B82CBAA